MTEALEAHFRLCCTLSHRTHEWSPPQPRKTMNGKRIVTGRGRGGNNRKPITIGKRVYETMKEARDKLKIGNAAIMRMIASGEAKRG